MSLPVAYAMKKRKKMAKGGESDPTDFPGGKVPPSEKMKGIHKPHLSSEGASSAGQDVRNDKSWKKTASKEDQTRSTRSPDLESAKNKHRSILNEMRSMKKPKLMAEGGQIEDNYQAEGNPHVDGGNVCPTCNMATPHESGETTGNYPGESLNQHGEDEGAGDSNGNDPFVLKIMMGREKGYSEGGKVANSDEIEADFEPNEFDDLHLRDDLEENYTESNSGDEKGDAQEDEDRADIIHRIMKSRAKKDRMPNPA